MWLKSNHSLFLKEILRVMISNLTFEIVLQNKHYALQCLVKGIRYKESLKKRTQKQTKQLSCTSHERTINNSTKTEQKVEKIWYPPIISHPNPNITTHPTFAYPHHLRNNIMVIITLAKMRQSNGCGIEGMMKYSTDTWDLLRALESALPGSSKTPATSFHPLIASAQTIN